MKQELFRREVIDASRDRLAGTVIAAVPPSSRLYTRLLLGTAFILLLILTFGSYASSASVRGIVAYDAGIARVYSTAPAEVREIHVRNGEPVEAGAPLVSLSIAQGINGVGSQLEQMASQEAELGRQIDLASALGSTEGRGLEQQRSSLSAGIASLERQRRIAESQVGLAEAATRRAADLAAQGAGTQRQVEDSRSQWLARRAEVESLNERIIAQRTALQAVQARFAERAIETDRNRSMLLAQRAALVQQRMELTRSDRLVLAAPVAGEVGDVSVEIGQRAQPDRTLVTIVPHGAQLELWLYAPSRAIGFARPGQQVRLYFDAFPAQKYGAGRGTVTAVSRVPVDPAGIDAQLGIQEPVFRIRVRIDEIAPRLPVERRTLRPGMTLTANLVLERRRLWEVLLAPVLRAVGR